MSNQANPVLDEEQANRRYAPRRSLRLDSVLGSGAEILIRDLSPTGLLIETAREMRTGETLLIDIPERGTVPATVVWASGRYYGCEFALSIPAAAVSAALLRSPVEARAAPLIEAAPTIVDEDEAWVAPAAPLPHRTRMAAIVGLSGLCWAAIGLVALRLF